MKRIIKICGALIILVIGLGFIFYGTQYRNLDKAEKAFKHGDFHLAEALYGKGIKGLDNLEGTNLARAWALYCEGYYNPEKYDLAEEIVAQELKKEKAPYKDQLYNLEALIYWQKGVDLFVKLGKKATSSGELNKNFEKILDSSDKALKAMSRNDWNIKYNWEFFRRPKSELMKSMQQVADSKESDKEKKEKGKGEEGQKQLDEQKKQADKEKQEGEGQTAKEDEQKNKEEKMDILTDKQEQASDKYTKGTNPAPKKKKKG